MDCSFFYSILFLKLFPKKHFTDRPSTSKVVTRIIEMIYRWSVDFKDLPIISQKYEIMKKQKIVLEDPVYVLEVNLTIISID